MLRGYHPRRRPAFGDLVSIRLPGLVVWFHHPNLGRRGGGGWSASSDIPRSFLIVFLQLHYSTSQNPIIPILKVPISSGPSPLNISGLLG